MIRINYLLLFFVAIACGQLNSQTTLTQGDLAIIGFKTSSGTDSGNDAVKLITLVELSCNTKFIVTDNNRRNNGTWYCDNDEFGVEITVNQTVPAGSVFYIDVDAVGGTATVSAGTITKTSLGGTWGTNYGLNSGGDNITLLQGTRGAPTFIYALRHNGTFASGGDCGSKNNTSLPSGLTLGTSAIQMSSSQDQWHYNCTGSITTGTRAGLLAAIGNTSNWTSAAGQSWNNSSCFFNVTDQWPLTGTLGVTGAGCGCLSGCNLSSMGGPNCSPSVSGNCSSGYQTMSTDISVPAGCSYTVYAAMRPWNTCGSSGADDLGSCPNCDRLKVDISGGAKSFQTGSSNATLSDSYTLAGPGTITVSGQSNRADEIIVYRVLSSTTGTPCIACAVPLAVEITEFEAIAENQRVKLLWTSLSEEDVAYFVIERSEGNELWEKIATVAPNGTGATNHYTIYDSSPLSGLAYYRLVEISFDGGNIVSEIRSVLLEDQKRPVKFMNLLGQEVQQGTSGILLVVYSNGEIEKIYNQ